MYPTHHTIMSFSHAHTPITCNVCGETTYVDHEYCVHCGANNAKHRGLNQKASTYLGGADLYKATETELTAYFGKGWRQAD